MCDKCDELAQQTAAKDAGIAELKRQLKSLEKTMQLEDETTAVERKGWADRAEAAERERDSLRAAGRTGGCTCGTPHANDARYNIHWAGCAYRLKYERDKALRENAALKAGKDGQQ